MGRLASLCLIVAAMAAGTPAVAQDKVKVGTTASASDAGIFIAAERGYFREQNLDVTITPFTSALTMFSAIATGQLDAGRSAQSAGLFNGLGRGIEVKLVADGSRLSKGGGYLAIALRKDLADTVKGPADFKGRTVAIAGPGGTSEIVLDRYLRTGGLTIAEVKRVTIPAPDQLAAMRNGNIDAAIALEPAMTAMVENGFAVRFKGGDEIYPDMQAALLVLSPAFAQKKDAAQRFVNAYVKALRDYNDAFFHDKNRDTVLAVLTKHTAIKNPDIYRKTVPAGLDPNGALNVQGLKDDLKWYTDHGLVKDPVDIDRFIDSSFAAKAAQSLGPYRP
jgi:NitT/TauT family transport system substrate-binding protein